MTEWLAWVDVLEDPGGDGSRVRRYVTHGVPFLQLTPFRSAAARYSTREVARTIASYAADPQSPFGAEQARGSIGQTRRMRLDDASSAPIDERRLPRPNSSPGGTRTPRPAVGQALTWPASRADLG
jgi:hypothetical protein